jgi:hypothetical protein
MFGASEDRARQLAYRKRRERIASGTSSSTCHSISSASCVLQRSRVPSVLDHNTAPSSAAAHRSLQPDESTCALISATEARHLRMERRRLQAEHVSQVAYRSLSLATTGLGSEAAFEPMIESDSYGGLGRSTKTRHIRNVTAPVASIKLQSLLASALRPPLNLEIPSRLPRTTCSEQHRAHIMTILRDGGQEDLPWQEEAAELKPLSSRYTTRLAHSTRQPPQVNTLTADVAEDAVVQDVTEYHHSPHEHGRTHYWAKDFYDNPAWIVPISTGDCLPNFLITLPSDIHHTFMALIGRNQIARNWTSFVANVHDDFYQKLDIHRRHLFDQIIGAKGEELRAVRLGLGDPQYSQLCPRTERVMVYHLLEATESLLSLSPKLFTSMAQFETYLRHSSIPMTAMEPWRSITSMGSRSSSTPNFGQRSQYEG